jgi:hypothetical protein
VASNDTHAVGTLARMSEVSRGRDAFFASFCQDLNDICTYCEETDSSEIWTSGVREKVSTVLQCLADTISQKARPRKCKNGTCHFCLTSLLKTHAQRLQEFREHTSGWNYDQTLSTDQLAWLQGHVKLQNLAAGQRQEILKRTTDVAKLPRRDAIEESGEPDTAGRDDWALKRAISLCEPLEDVRKALFCRWKCDCPDPDEHTSLLASFAIPCQKSDAGAYCMLRFATSLKKATPWSTVSLDVAAGEAPKDCPGDAKHAVSPPSTERFTASIGDDNTAPVRLHDCLVRWSGQQTAAAKLKFCLDSKECVLTAGDANSDTRYTMVSLESLLAQDSTHPIKKWSFIERLTLALLVAYAFVQLGDTDGLWFPYSMDKINIWFYQAANDAPILLQPYIEVDLRAIDDHSQIQSEELGVLRLINGAMPCLPMLGKLILELVDGTPIEKLGTIEKSMEDYRHQQPMAAPFVLGAVKVCMFDQMLRQETIQDSEISRNHFLDQVIGRLNTLLSECGSSMEAELKKAHGQIPKRAEQARKRRQSSTLETQTTKRPQLSMRVVGSKHDESAYCCHDDGSYHALDQSQ